MKDDGVGRADVVAYKPVQSAQSFLNFSTFDNQQAIVEALIGI